MCHSAVFTRGSFYLHHVIANCTVNKPVCITNFQISFNCPSSPSSQGFNSDLQTSAWDLCEELLHQHRHWQPFLMPNQQHPQHWRGKCFLTWKRRCDQSSLRIATKAKRYQGRSSSSWWLPSLAQCQQYEGQQSILHCQLVDIFYCHPTGGVSTVNITSPLQPMMFWHLKCQK